MIQSIYTSVSNAELTPCQKGCLIPSEPIPLLKNNYLGEYRTAMEKAKVRKNLGIADDQTLLWGNIKGRVDELTDLIDFILSLLDYTNSLLPDVDNVKDALTKLFEIISVFEDNSSEISNILLSVTSLQLNLELVENIALQSKDDIVNLFNSIDVINDQIVSINEAIATIDVSANIKEWVTDNIAQSKTIELLEEILEVKISNSEDNALTILDGLYVETPKYNTSLSDNTESPLIDGMTVAKVKEKPISEIIDLLVFPAIVKTLEYPTLTYSIPQNSIVAVGSSLLDAQATFDKKDAGEEVERITSVLHNGVPASSYNAIGTYTYQTIVKYNSGEYLVNNRQEITDLRVEAGEITASLDTIATYPWYAGEGNNLVQLTLVPFDEESLEIEFPLTGNAVIKIPGANSKISMFMVDGGLGFLNIDMNGWSKSTEELNGVVYLVFTKLDSYSAILSHKIKFTLAL